MTKVNIMGWQHCLWQRWSATTAPKLTPDLSSKNLSDQTMFLHQMFPILDPAHTKPVIKGGKTVSDQRREETNGRADIKQKQSMTYC